MLTTPFPYIGNFSGMEFRRQPLAQGNMLEAVYAFAERESFTSILIDVQ